MYYRCSDTVVSFWQHPGPSESEIWSFKLFGKSNIPQYPYNINNTQYPHNDNNTLIILTISSPSESKIWSFYFWSNQTSSPHTDTFSFERIQWIQSEAAADQSNLDQSEGWTDQSLQCQNPYSKNTLFLLPSFHPSHPCNQTDTF